MNIDSSILKLSDYAPFLAKRLPDWHKGLSGHLLIIGGGQGYSGAPCMAALAALRVGAGLVTVATHPIYETTMNVAHPEIMSIAADDRARLSTLIEAANVIVLGPGLGQTDWALDLWQFSIDTICRLTKNCLIDADGLNLLAQSPVSYPHWVLTPHPGEAARLLQTSTSVIQQDRVSAVAQLQARFQGVVVLKGHETLVKGEAEEIKECQAGNPGMASAGMGDMLSGVIGGLIAQSMPLSIAAELGVLIHALAGDQAAKSGGERGLIATDLLPFLRHLVNLV